MTHRAHSEGPLGKHEIAQHARRTRLVGRGGGALLVVRSFAQLHEPLSKGRTIAAHDELAYRQSVPRNRAANIGLQAEAAWASRGNRLLSRAGAAVTGHDGIPMIPSVEIDSI